MRGSKRVYLVLMLLSGIAFLIDRVLLSDEPNVPVTVDAILTADTGSIVKSERVQAQMNFIPEFHFPRNLYASKSIELIRDPFAPPEQSQGGQEATGNRKGQRGLWDLLGRASGKIFLERHRLDGVLRQGRVQIAIVDGVWTYRGDSIDGCEMLGVIGHQVAFRCDDGKVLLEVRKSIETSAH